MKLLWSEIRSKRDNLDVRPLSTFRFHVIAVLIFLKTYAKDQGDSFSRLQERRIWLVYMFWGALISDFVNILTQTNKRIILKPLGGFFSKWKILEIKRRFMWPLSFIIDISSNIGAAISNYFWPKFRVNKEVPLIIHNDITAIVKG